ncbi:MAG TPA: D-alanyl-D-alanine carboxypeptidase, partial [Prolixibacteraceae bacterium]|nr:D-alanyl-D-alanine carboxypeptidase [Prolixibacteraceae bacterium]
MKLPFFAAFLLVFSFSAIGQNSFNAAVKNFQNQPEYKNASIGIHVIDLKTGEPLFALNEKQLMIPASTLKLATSAVALELLGAGYRFQTKIGFVGKIERETLNGDLVVIGGGDPALGSEYFKDHYFKPHFLDVWVQKIKDAGIEQVRGDLVLDVSVYDSEKNPPTWVWED